MSGGGWQLGARRRVARRLLDLGQRDDAAPPPDLLERLRADIPPHPVRVPTAVAGAGPRRWAVAASLAAAAVAVLLALTGRLGRERLESRLAQMAQAGAAAAPVATSATSVPGSAGSGAPAAGTSDGASSRAPAGEAPFSATGAPPAARASAAVRPEPQEKAERKASHAVAPRHAAVEEEARPVASAPLVELQARVDVPKPKVQQATGGAASATEAPGGSRQRAGQEPAARSADGIAAPAPPPSPAAPPTSPPAASTAATLPASALAALPAARPAPTETAAPPASAAPSPGPSTTSSQARAAAPVAPAAPSPAPAAKLAKARRATSLFLLDRLEGAGVPSGGAIRAGFGAGGSTAGYRAVRRALLEEGRLPRSAVRVEDLANAFERLAPSHPGEPPTAAAEGAALPGRPDTFLLRLSVHGLPGPPRRDEVAVAFDTALVAAVRRVGGIARAGGAAALFEVELRPAALAAGADPVIATLSLAGGATDATAPPTPPTPLTPLDTAGNVSAAAPPPPLLAVRLESLRRPWHAASPELRLSGLAVRLGETLAPNVAPAAGRRWRDLQEEARQLTAELPDDPGAAELQRLIDRAAGLAIGSATERSRPPQP